MTRPTKVRRALLGCTALLIGAAWPIAISAGSAASAASATTTTQPQAPFGMTPARGPGAPTNAGHFEYSVPAGASIHDAVIVENLTNVPQTLQVFGADMQALAGGGFAPAQLGAQMHGVGAWTQVSQPSVTLAPLALQTVTFSVNVPTNTFSGDYLGAIVSQNSPTAGRGVAIQTRVALQIQMHITGATAHLDARVGPLQTKVSAGSISYTAVVANTGNESFQFIGTLHVQTGSSSVDIAVSMKPTNDYLFPGQQVTLGAHYDHPPRWGSVTARATLLAAPARGTAATFSDGPVTLHFFPWLLLILAIIALLLLLYVSRQAWRNRELWRARFREARDRRREIRRFKQGLGA